jgi:hypothetical protein
MELALKKLLIAAVVAMAVPLFAHAGFNEGLSAAERGDFIGALENWQPLPPSRSVQSGHDV